MRQDFNIFLETDTDKEFCPKMEITDEPEKIKELVDWDKLDKAPCVNDDGEAMVVIGYYKQETAESHVKFHRCYTISSKTKQKVYHQHKDGYDMILFRAMTDEGGKPLETIEKQVVGVLKINGKIVETMKKGEDAPNDEKRMYMELVRDMSLPIDGKLRVFVTIIPKKKSKKKSKGSPATED